MEHSPKSLIHHISRLEGQLASIKKELAENKPDCQKAAATLKAASRSFTSLRQAFVACFLRKDYIKKADDPKLASLLSIINS